VGVFLYGVLRPRERTEWRSAGWAQAWVIALYAEMYGWPLTAHLALGWLGHAPSTSLRHWNGHLWPLLFGLTGDDLVRAQIATTVIGQALIAVGGLLALWGWRVLHRAARAGEMATRGPYRWVRHPQYAGFLLFLAGSVLNWPTLPTLVTLPILVGVYLRLARAEERESIAAFGDHYRAYMARTSRFVPGWGLPEKNAP